MSGDLDLSTQHEGQLMARITGAVARKESDDKSRRIQRKHQEIAQAGRPSGGGTRPFGYESDQRTVRPVEAAVIRECASRILIGDSLRSVCMDLNLREVPTVTGKQWSTQTLRRLVMSARISGQREHLRETVAKAEWEAIITRAETQRIRAKLSDPARRTNKSARRYLLTRLLRCGHCQVKLYSRPRADGSRRYVCASGPNFGGCGKLTVVADQLEAFVVEAVLHRLDSPELAGALAGRSEDAHAAEWQAEIETAQEQLNELATLWGSKTISQPEWLAARAPIEQRQKLAKRRLAALNRTNTLADQIGNGATLRDRWGA